MPVNWCMQTCADEFNNLLHPLPVFVHALRTLGITPGVPPIGERLQEVQGEFLDRCAIIENVQRTEPEKAEARAWLLPWRCGPAGKNCCCCNRTPCSVASGLCSQFLQPTVDDMTEKKAGKTYTNTPMGRRHYAFHEILAPRGGRRVVFSCEVLAVRLLNPGWPMKGFVPSTRRGRQVGGGANQNHDVYRASSDDGSDED